MRYVFGSDSAPIDTGTQRKTEGNVMDWFAHWNDADLTLTIGESDDNDGQLLIGLDDSEGFCHAVWRITPEGQMVRWGTTLFG